MRVTQVGGGSVCRTHSSGPQEDWVGGGGGGGGGGGRTVLPRLVKGIFLDVVL